MAGQLTIGQALLRLGGEAFLQRLIGQVEAVAAGLSTSTRSQSRQPRSAPRRWAWAR